MCLGNDDPVDRQVVQLVEISEEDFDGFVYLLSQLSREDRDELTKMVVSTEPEMPGAVKKFRKETIRLFFAQLKNNPLGVQLNYLRALRQVCELEEEATQI